MAHEIESAFYARQAAWHGLGTVVETEQRWEDAQRLAKLDWEVQKEPTFTQDGMQALAYAIRRRDNGVIVGSVGDQYTPFQNKDAFRFMDAAVGEGLASFHTAGSLKNGRTVWCLCRLPGDLGTAEDKVQKYGLLVTSHDGSKAVTFMLTPTRVVCWNTLNLALGAANGRGVKPENGFKARHSRMVFERVADAKRLIAEAEGRLAEFDAQSKRLVLTPFSDDDFRRMILQLYPPPAEAIQSGKRADVPTHRQNAWASMFTSFKVGPGADLPTAKNTAWGAVNAVADFVDHHRPTRAPSEDLRGERRMESILWGSGAAVKQRAAEIVMEYADKGPETLKSGNGSLLDQLLEGVGPLDFSGDN